MNAQAPDYKKVAYLCLIGTGIGLIGNWVVGFAAGRVILPLAILPFVTAMMALVFYVQYRQAQR